MPEKKISDERVLSAFVDKMITDKDALVTEKDRAALFRVLMEQVHIRIESAMISALSDEQLVELNRMLDEGASDDEIEALFNENGVDLTGSVELALIDLRNNYLENGDNPGLIELGHRQYEEFLETAPDGQGYPIGMDPREEQA